MDDPQKRWSCVWKADELVTVGTLVLFWGQDAGGGWYACRTMTGRVTGDAGALPECEMIH